MSQSPPTAGQEQRSRRRLGHQPWSSQGQRALQEARLSGGQGGPATTWTPPLARAIGLLLTSHCRSRQLRGHS